VDALAEAIAVIRALWTPGPPVTFHGAHHRLEGARPAPPPHPIEIWLGAYKPRMLRLTGRAADGWIPSLGYAAPEDLDGMNRAIDDAAEEAGRRPADIRRAFNVSGAFGRAGPGFLQGPPAAWAEQLGELALERGISAFVLGVGPEALDDLRRFAEEVAPAVREAVARERLRRVEAPAAAGAARVTTAEPRPRPAPEAPAAGEDGATPVGREGQRTLLAIHEHLRQELSRLREVIEQVAAGRAPAEEARSYLARMTMRQNLWTLGAFCAA
jgi:hypothetical protein